MQLRRFSSRSWFSERKSPVRSRSRSRGGGISQVEALESRTLLSARPHLRIINGEEIAEHHPRIINGTPSSSFPSVGEVGDRFGTGCTGTLIGPQHVLTAGHCAEDVGSTQGRFRVNGTTYSTSRVIVHPSFNGNRIGVDDSANDIAIFELSTTVSSISPSPIFRGTPRVGEVLTLVGFGAGGNGNSGEDGTYGTKRVGTTPIDGVTARRILWRFDNNRESNTAPGDSGGPAYLEVGGVFFVAGVTSGGDKADAGIGDNSYDTRVDAYASWIDSIVGTSPDPNPDPDPDPDPIIDDHPDEPAPGATPLLISAGGTFQATGILEEIGDRDVFVLEVATRGSATIELGNSSGSVDTYLRVYDSNGTLVGQDDDSGPGTDSRLVVSLHSGIYYVSAASFNDADSGDFTLSGEFVADDHGDIIAEATELPLSPTGQGIATGRIGHSGDRDVFKIMATRGGSHTIDLKASGSELDTVLTVYDHRGRRIASNDDTAGSSDSRVQVRLRLGQTYFVQAAGYRESQGKFSLQIAPTPSPRPRGHKRNQGGAIIEASFALRSGTPTSDVATAIGASLQSRPESSPLIELPSVHHSTDLSITPATNLREYKETDSVDALLSQGISSWSFV